MSNVCPDRQLLSVYFDGELPSPWKEKMEAHIAVCAQCARRLESYRGLSQAAASGPGSGGDVPRPAQERVWQRLEQCALSTPAANPGGAVWQRRISIPIPAAAAAAVLVVALASLLLLRTISSGEDSGMAAGITFASEAELDIPGFVPALEMENVLQYLGGRDNGEIIILRLPESRSFVNYSEPAIIRAADYSRQVGRQTPVRK
ncbi:MAG: hypothetical protein LBI06_06925 [Treponema sp.]|nr:hypothetical protein [Treponema sp.]